MKTLSKTCLFFLLLIKTSLAVTYRVGSGDVLQIQVLGESEFTGHFQVNEDGAIDFPFILKVSVSGLSVEEVDRKITDLLKSGYLRDPQVNVSVKEYQSQKVLVFGSVVRPGRYVLTQETRLLELLSLAGGLSGAGGKRVLLFRDGLIESNKALPKDSDSKPAIVSDSNSVVNPSGAVSGTQLAENELNSGIPNKTPTVIDYFGLVHDGKMDQNLVLKDGDIINVPEANQVFVLGNVAKPGPVKYENKMTILQAVTLSGGATLSASTKNTYVLRRGKKGEEKISVRLDKILESKETNFILEADDVVILPESFF